MRSGVDSPEALKSLLVAGKTDVDFIDPVVTTCLSAPGTRTTSHRAADSQVSQRGPEDINRDADGQPKNSVADELAGWE
jgi:hypothetical protein